MNIKELMRRMVQMSARRLMLPALLFTAGGATGLKAQEADPAAPVIRSSTPRVQLVFCLDVTGSMGGLIETARQKIWSIASSVVQSNEQPDLQVGLVFYRDKGDAFITSRVELTRDLDSVYLKLSDMAAGGGGDSPEDVNAGLLASVKDMNWNMDSNVYRAIFLVGDCGPHMDYAGEPKYPEIMKMAKGRDIVINTILMGGGCADSKSVWQSIAAASEGSFFEVGYDAGGFVMATPFDGELATLQARLDSMVLYYGDAETVHRQETKMMNTNVINMKGKMSEKASRAAYKTSAIDKSYYHNDLMTDLKTGRVKLETLDTAHMPARLKAMPVAERKTYVDSLIASRDSLQAKISVTNKKRQEFIAAETNKVKGGKEHTFSSGVYHSIQTQSARKKIVLTGKATE